ncbi:MAG: class I SAM-dependent methyltransferase [Lachnospiraceae bacterium]|nr:class I SAM-dependent methyltransferase [Lachnospiraceae bacterium]
MSFVRGGKSQLVKKRTRNSYHKIVQCVNCGLQQLFPLPTLKEDAIYYDINPHDRETTPEFSVEDIYSKFEFQNQSRIRYLENFGIEKHWKILDYGCGYGFFIEMMEREGYCLDGIEISKDKLVVCKARLGETAKRIKAINLLNEELPEYMENRYDLITMFHLLEHITQPIELLKKVKKMLNEKGHLVIEVPNVANKMMEASEAYNDFFYIRDHVAYYTPDILKKLLLELGFRIVVCCGNQVYGLTNHMNWIINGKPELKKPSYESCASMRWIEKIYKETMNCNMWAEYMYVIACKEK